MQLFGLLCISKVREGYLVLCQGILVREGYLVLCQGILVREGYLVFCLGGIFECDSLDAGTALTHIVNYRFSINNTVFPEFHHFHILKKIKFH